LKLNVGKCKSITFPRLRHPVEFSYMLGGIILDRVDSITDLGFVMDNKMSFSRQINPEGFGNARICEKTIR
jgi:hypothetical protein